MARTGRPKVEIDLKLLEKLCLIQCTDEEIAAWFDVSVETIDNRKKSDPEFFKVYKNSKEKGKMSLRRRMYDMADKGDKTMLIWLSKQYLGMADRSEVSSDVNLRGNLAVGNLSDDELNARIEALVLSGAAKAGKTHAKVAADNRPKG